MAKTSPITVIAEAGVNHNGSIERALELIRVAADCKADIVKFQTFKASKITTGQARQAQYQIENMGQVETQQNMLEKLELSESDHFKLADACLSSGIEFLSTPFDVDSLEFLTKHKLIKRIKIPSGELTNLPFILAASRSGLPLILSTGMATLGEIEQALMCIAYGLTHAAGIPRRENLLQAYSSKEGQELLKKHVIVLHCTTEYPAPFAEINLKVIRNLRRAFPTPIGFSDHSKGIAIPIASAALGVCLIEKHFTLDKELEGPDHKASLDPLELAAMIDGVRQVELSLGHSIKIPSSSEIKNRDAARKSLVAACTIETGVRFSQENLVCKRPGSGISAEEFWNVIGKTARKTFQADDLIDLEEF